MPPESRCHDQPLTPHSIFFVTSEPLPEGTPLRLILPGVPAACDLLLAWVRACVPGAREIVFDSPSSGPDAEAALMDFWAAMPERDRQRVWGLTGPMAGVLARFEDRSAVGFALLASTPRGSEPLNAQSRAVLMASVADSWSLALDSAPPVDADSWRSRLWSTLESRWRIGWLEDPVAAAGAFCEAMGLNEAERTRINAAARHSPAPAQRGIDDAPAGWLDRELLARPADLLHPPKRSAAPVRARSTRQKPDPSSKVVRGRHGRLFLGMDSHDSHRQIVGGRPLTRQELDAWAHGTEERVSDLAAAGADYVQLIGPAPQAVHPNDLPDGVLVAQDRPVTQVLDRLGRLEPRPRVLYPLDVLQRVRDFRDPFSKTDSHWNDLGTYLAYETILDSLRADLAVRRLGRGDVSFEETCYEGDLGGKLRPTRASVFVRARVDTSRARLVEDNRVRNHGRRTVFACDAAPPTTCIVFGDSWAYSLMLFLAESFRRVVFFHRVNIVDRAPVLDERPDLVISVMTERFCTALPLDHEAVDFERVVAKKLELNDVVPERAPNERHPFLFSLALDRGLTGRGFYLPR